MFAAARSSPEGLLFWHCRQGLRWTGEDRLGDVSFRGGSGRFGEGGDGGLGGGVAFCRKSR